MSSRSLDQTGQAPRVLRPGWGRRAGAAWAAAGAARAGRLYRGRTRTPGRRPGRRGRRAAGRARGRRGARAPCPGTAGAEFRGDSLESL